MDAMVTARVPMEIKEQGNSILKSIGATATDLVNAAYTYVIKTRELPQVKSVADTGSSRELDQSHQAELRSIMEGMSVCVPDSIMGKSFEELRDELWEDRNARFS